MSDIEKALALVDELQTKRAQHVAKAEKLENERNEIALGAFTGDGKNRKRLDEIHTTLARHGSELAALDSALKSAHQRVADLRQAEEQAAARQKAEEMRKVVAELGEWFPYLDRHLTEAARALIAIHDGIAKLHAAGFSFPSDAQVRIGITAVIQTWAHRLPRSWHDQLRDGFEFLAPGRRQTATEYWSKIQASVNNSIRQATGEAERTDTEAA
jgi:hypothetical protein